MFEKVIIQNIFDNKKYGAEYIEFLKGEYFELIESRYILNKIEKYFNEYNIIPSKAEIQIELSQDTNITEDNFEACIEYIKELENQDHYHEEYIKKSTRKWITDRAFENAVIRASEKMSDGKDISYIQEEIRAIYAISFNETIGNSFWRDTEKQQEYYNEKADKFACNLTELNKVCGGGVERKTLNILMAPTSTGKTTALCSLASSYLKRGFNVLYITCEMAEEKIRQRIEANHFHIPINDIPDIDKETYFKKMNFWAKNATSNLYIKEYPNAFANVNHIRALLDNLESKENFKPDILLIDYVGIMTSTRIKDGGQLYSYHKSIAEEIRGLMVERNLVGWSALQSNRDGEGKSDLSLNNSADSYGTPMTVDLQIGLIETNELKSSKTQIWKCLKTRYSDLKGYMFKVIVEHEYGSVTDAENNGSIESKEESKEMLKTPIDTKMKSLNLGNKKKLKGLQLDFS